MRFLVVIGAMLLAACASTGEPAAFAPNQVWTLLHPPSPDARLVVDALEIHGDRTVVRYSLVMEPPPEAVARGMAGMMGLESGAGAAGEPRDVIARLSERRIPEDRLNELSAARPTQIQIGSMFFEDARWRSGGMAVMLSREPDDDTPTTARINGFATYDSVLRADLAGLAVSETPPEFIAQDRDEQGAIELMIPVDEGAVLSRPLSVMLDDVAAYWRGEPVPWPERPDPGPAAPVFPEASETPIEDAALDEACRARLEIPRDTSLEEQMVRLNERRVAIGKPTLPVFIPDVERTFANVAITRSEEWSVIWRAEMSFEGAEGRVPPGLVRCWRPRDGGSGVQIAIERPSAP